jgi:hypothetical protein
MQIKRTRSAAKKSDARPVKAPGIKTTNARFPLMLIVRENCFTYRNAPLSRLLTGFHRLRHDGSVWVGPGTAQKYNVTDNADVTILGDSINLRKKVHFNENMPDDTILVYADTIAAGIRSQPVRIEVVVSDEMKAQKDQHAIHGSGSE